MPARRQRDPCSWRRVAYGGSSQRVSAPPAAARTRLHNCPVVHHRFARQPLPMFPAPHAHVLRILALRLQPLADRVVYNTVALSAMQIRQETQDRQVELNIDVRLQDRAHR